MTSATVPELPRDRLTARVMAHALVEQMQVSPMPEVLGRLAEQARSAGWPEVRVMLLHGQLIARCLQNSGARAIRQSADAMLNAAQAGGDEILIGLALASRALFIDDLGEDVGGLLAQAVAMIDDTLEFADDALGLRALEVPVVYVECGQAFHRLGLWEIEEEMYVRAAAALTAPLPPVARSVPSFTRRALVINRLESALALSSAMIEVGLRDPAARVAATSIRPTPSERADLPAMWAVEALALERFLDVVAGRTDLPGGPGHVPADLYDQLAPSTWPGYRACLLLAAAIACHDDGDVPSAARLAGRAAGFLDDTKPSLTSLALCLAAQDCRDRTALRYARHVADQRWQSRLAVLGAMRSRLAAARVLRQGERLTRQANVDALTGLANRHAETALLARLRRRAPQERLGVVVVDVDHFKQVNDTYGHLVGDEVLRAVGTLLQAATRPGDLAIRRGGDEMVLLIDLPPGDDVPVLADGIVRAVALHHWEDLAPGLRVGVSAGQAVGPARDVDRLIEEADCNLYRAKDAGRGRAVAAAG
ncbi:GGDEF domain-containing protein [Actinoplanes sp. NPDC089786]|uniref:sensor domain-containing diguanylate cyclase n=1 Tax=Actinoplanes sp. NPDC089786 TaxID=3155185 RepID=UPI003441790C